MKHTVARNQTASKGGVNGALSHAACVASVMLWSRGLAPVLDDDDDAGLDQTLCTAEQLDTTSMPPNEADAVAAVQRSIAAHTPRVKRCLASQDLWCVLSKWQPCPLPREEVRPTTERVWLVSPRPRAHNRVRKPDVVELVVHAMQMQVQRVVVIMPSAAAFNHHCRQAVRDAQAQCSDGAQTITFEVIEFSQLCGIKPMHVLVPRMSVVPPEEEPGVLQAWASSGVAKNAARDSLPRILSSDAIARWFAWAPDTLVQYTARLGHGTPAFTMVRRVEEENTASATYSASGERKRSSGWLLV